MRRGLLLLLLPWLVAAIPDQPPAPITLTESEAKEVASGDVVVRLDDSGTGGEVTGIVDIAAPKEAVWEALFDFGARVDEIGALKAVSTYDEDDGDGTLSVRWELKVMGMSVVFHNAYRRDFEAGWCRYGLDASKDNDLVAVDGAYQVYAHGDGTRLVYRSATDSGRSVPRFIKNWLATGSLTEQLEGVRRRALQGAASR